MYPVCHMPMPVSIINSLRYVHRLYVERAMVAKKWEMEKRGCNGWFFGVRGEGGVMMCVNR